MGMFSGGDVAVDLGTANTSIYTRGAVVLNEPSVVAFNTVRGGVEAIGIDAREMLGRTPANITPIWPMRAGVIADFEAVEKMLAHFVRKATGRAYWRQRLVIGVPAASTPVERRAVKDSARRMKVSDVQLVDEPMAAAIGAGLPVTEPTGNMIVDIGGGTTDIAVLSLGGVVYGRSLRLAGGDMDEAIIQHVKRRHNLLIGERTAERIKCELGSAAPLSKPLKMEVKGRHLSEGVPRTATITDEEVAGGAVRTDPRDRQGDSRGAGMRAPGIVGRHFRARRGADRRRGDAPEIRRAPAQGNRTARADRRGPDGHGRRGRGQAAHRPEPAVQGRDRRQLSGGRSCF